MYILYNHDGSIKEKNLNEYIQQGNAYVNALFISIAGYSNADYEIGGIAVLPNGDRIALLGQNATQEVRGESYNGKTLTLPNTITAIEGIVNLTIAATQENKVLATYQVKLNVNPTGIEGDEPINLSVDQYLELLSSIQAIQDNRWGKIEGNIEDQLDLKEKFEEIYDALNDKVSNDSFNIYKTQVDDKLLLKEDKSNKTEVISSQSTTEKYPSAKAVYDYVNDRVSQSASYFRGSFEHYSDLIAVAWQTTDPDADNYVTNNDYAVVDDDETNNGETWRYRYVLGSGWEQEYKVNNTPFTQTQLDAINSGINATKLTSIENGLADKSSVVPLAEKVEGATEIKALEIDGQKVNLAGGVSEVNWGDIGGNINNQTDLQQRFSDILEKVQGKNDVYIISYNDTIAKAKERIELYNVRAHKYNPTTKKFDIDITDAMANGEYDYMDDWESGEQINILVNRGFNNNNLEWSFLSTGSLLVRYLSGGVEIAEDWNDIYLIDDSLPTLFNVGDIILVIELNVPDRWFGGWSTLYALETQKITDESGKIPSALLPIASANNLGVIRSSVGYGTEVSASNGAIRATVETYSSYSTKDDRAIIGKKTLENVLKVRIGDTSRLTGATQSLSLEANINYLCTETLTSLTITSFANSGGVGNPMWEIKFKTGTSFTANFPNTLNWVNGVPDFEPNTEFTIYVEECIEEGKYDATIVEK